MIYLDFTTKKLQVVLSGAVTTNQWEISAYYTDHIPQSTTTIRRGGTQVTNTNNTTDVDIVEAPALHGTVRNIHTIMIYNKDTADGEITVKLDDGGTETILVRQRVKTEKSLIYEDQNGWQLLEPSSVTVSDSTDNPDLTFITNGATTITLPNSGTMATRAGSETFTNKTIGTSNIITSYDDSWTLQDNLDPTKQLQLQLSGLTTATTRVLTVPDANTTIVGTDATQTLTNKTISLGSNTLSMTSAQLAAAVSDETGSGALVFATSPSFVTPSLGAATATTPAANDNDTSVATTAYVQTELTAYASDTVTFTNKTLTNPTINAGSGVIVLPQTATPAQTAEGSIVWDTDDLLTVGTGAGRKTMVDTDSSQTITNKTINASNNTISNITQAHLGSGSVGQAQLKTGDNQGTVSTSGNSSLSGGRYLFQPTAYLGGGSSADGLVVVIQAINREGASPAYLTATSLDLGQSHLSRGNELTYAFWDAIGDDQRTWSVKYVTSSPPYDLGDGEVPLFVYAQLDSSGNVLNVVSAEDPPWAHCGPTDITPDVYGQNGKTYKYIRDINPADKALLAIPSRQREALERIRNAPRTLVEITQEMKNRNMPYNPQPFHFLPAGHQVVMLPVSDVLEDLAFLRSIGENMGGLLIDKYITLDNVPLNRAGPPGVLQVQPKWKLT